MATSEIHVSTDVFINPVPLLLELSNKNYAKTT